MLAKGVLGSHWLLLLLCFRIVTGGGLFPKGNKPMFLRDQNHIALLCQNELNFTPTAISDADDDPLTSFE